MFMSIRAKLFLLLVIVMTVSTFAVIGITHKNLEQEFARLSHPFARAALQSDITIRLARRQAYLMLGILACSLLIANVFSKKITRPLELLSLYAQRLSEKRITDREERAGITFEPTSPEIAQLQQSFLVMETQITHQVEQLDTYRQHLEELTAARTRELAETNRQLQHEIAEHRRTEAHLKASEARYRNVVEDQTELICRWQPDGTLTFVNDAYCRYFGKSCEELLGMNFLTLIPEQDQHNVEHHFQSFNREHPVAMNEHRVISQDGDIRWNQWNNRAFFDEQDHIIEFQSVGRDITERKQAEEHLQAALKEKEILLKEIHHRVKNNLQVVSSLLKFQTEGIQDARTLELFRDCQNRIKTMSLIHESLYQGKNVGAIHLEGYLRSLTVSLFRLFTEQTTSIDLLLDIEEVELDIDTAIACGLIVNELLSNSLKYAFPVKRREELHRQGKHLEIHIRFVSHTEHEWSLCVSDNGIGFSEHHDPSQATSLGLQLVYLLTRQLKGTMVWDRCEGTRFTLTFPQIETGKTPLRLIAQQYGGIAS